MAVLFFPLVCDDDDRHHDSVGDVVGGFGGDHKDGPIKGPEPQDCDVGLPEHFVRVKNLSVKLDRFVRSKHFITDGLPITPEGITLVYAHSSSFK